MIQALNNQNTFPPFIHFYLNTIRLTGNIGTHTGLGAKEDVEALLPIFVLIVEWFINTQLAKI